MVERQLLEVHKYVCHKICELSEGVWVVERQLLEVHKYVYKYVCRSVGRSVGRSVNPFFPCSFGSHPYIRSTLLVTFYLHLLHIHSFISTCSHPPLSTVCFPHAFSPLRSYSLPPISSRPTSQLLLFPRLDNRTSFLPTSSVRYSLVHIPEKSIFGAKIS